MKTDDLIAMLATGTTAVDRSGDARRNAAQLVLGAALALVLTWALFGPRSDLAQAVVLPMFSFKLLFTASLAGASLWALHRLAVPGSPTRRLPLAVAVPVLVVWAGAVLALSTTQRDTWNAQLMGSSWAQCPLNIALLAVPALWLTLHGLKNAAPIHLRSAGAAAGLFAGAVAAFAYTWHCPEMGVPFLAVWYVLGMAPPTAVGACLGPRVLRW